ncbi:stalk domain-containing protein [Paenibacillus herberti]|uniref:stalk domain-containing protein n=1 Tax=Paenibacillus herberti TaxID=1619309 RepID=UPI001595D52E|nr:hypothetical protein [Paenibacillus herberti]
MATSLLFSGSPTTFASNSIQVEGNDMVYSDFTVVNDHVYVQLDTLTDMVGALARWGFEDKNRAGFITGFSSEGNSNAFIYWFKNSKKVKITLDDNIEEVNMKLSTISKDNRIYIPLREAIVALNKDIKIEWKNKEKKVTVKGKIIY